MPTTAQTPVISIVTRNFNDLVPLLITHHITGEYIRRCNPTGDSVTRNECFTIVYSDYDKASKGYPVRIDVFINPAYTVCCKTRKRG